MTIFFDGSVELVWNMICYYGMCLKNEFNIAENKLLVCKHGAINNIFYDSYSPTTTGDYYKIFKLFSKGVN